MATVVSDVEVREGFLCPVCLQDLTSVAQLQVHFEEKHATEDSAVLNSIKSIFSKAKKFLNDSEDEEDGNTHGTGSAYEAAPNTPSGSKIYNAASPAIKKFDTTTKHSFNNPWNWKNLNLGPKRSHSSFFKKIRSDRIDAYVAETNKLLLRLDKLLADIPTDPVKRKAHERDIVPWADDNHVPLCPDCGRSFGALTRRRHHCRLCGAIMCHSCSKFLSMAFAKKLVTPVHAASSMSEDYSSGQRPSPSHSRNSNNGSIMGLTVPGFGGLRRSGSQGSLNSLVSVVDSLTGEQHFRTCQHCYQRVSARDKAIEQRQSKPLLSLLYNKLMMDRSTMLQLLPQYNSMTDSLWQGETVYNLRDATDLHMKILRLSDSINATGQKIRNLGPVDSTAEPSPDELPPAPHPRQEILQRRIQQGTTTFLRANVLGLNKLPEPQELEMLQQARKKAAAEKLAAEREAAELAEKRAEMLLQKMRQRDSSENFLKSIGRESDRVGSPARRDGRSQTSTSSRSGGSSHGGVPRQSYTVVAEDGWGGVSDAHVVTTTDDPVIQQMNIIRNYIKEAREASRYDEVATLERNLKELQEEYRRLTRKAV